MTPVVVTMRVAQDPCTGERRDALDQAWHPFLAACGLQARPSPNYPPAALSLLDGAAGLILSGGGDILQLGGSHPERDATEGLLLDAALARAIPVIGVCRGMQFLCARFGARFVRMSGHVGQRHAIILATGETSEVNSFHNFGIETSCFPFEVLARSPDGYVEAMRAPKLKLSGLMWHPEREPRPRAADIGSFRHHLGMLD